MSIVEKTSNFITLDKHIRLPQDAEYREPKKVKPDSKESVEVEPVDNSEPKKVKKK